MVGTCQKSPRQIDGSMDPILEYCQTAEKSDVHKRRENSEGAQGHGQIDEWNVYRGVVLEVVNGSLQSSLFGLQRTQGRYPSRGQRRHQLFLEKLTFIPGEEVESPVVLEVQHRCKCIELGET